MKTVIYIASDVRSGSTMLDNFLSNKSNAESVGELRLLSGYLNKYGSGDEWDWGCTCEKSLGECDVWTQVTEKIKTKYHLNLNEIETRSNQQFRSKLFHVLMLLAIVIPSKTIKKYLVKKLFKKSELEKFGKNLFNIMECFAEVTGAEIIIDSSKNMVNLLALQAGKPTHIDLKMIHIIRDGRAVIYSKKKRSEEHKHEYRFFQSIRGWWYINQQLTITSYLFDKKNAMTVGYESLCKNPEATLKKICSKFNLDYEESMKFLSNENKHNIGGTSHRFTWNKETPIRLDERWKSSFGRWPKILVNFLKEPQ